MQVIGVVDVFDSLYSFLIYKITRGVEI